MQESHSRFWMTPKGWAVIVLVMGAGYLLLAEHEAHVIAALPWLILLACPLMHLFMHRGHGHGGTDQQGRHPDGEGR